MLQVILIKFPSRRIQLCILFGIGLVTIIITTIRLPLTLSENDQLEIRTVRARVRHYLQLQTLGPYRVAKLILVGIGRDVLRMHCRQRSILLRTNQGFFARAR